MNERYHRQFLLPEIGQEGQEKLNRAKVLIVGAGGLGCPNALYLTGAGVGTIGLVDADTVSLSNLHRQIIYTEAEVGLPKVKCAASHLHRMNRHVRIHPYPFDLTTANAMDIICQYDLVIDGTDNYSTRYIISDTCAHLHKPYIYGAITGFEGQVALLCHPSGKRTYRDLYPFETGMGSTPAGQEVMPLTPGVVGCMQANEALKIICGYGHPLIDRLWTIDLRTLETNIISL